MTTAKHRPVDGMPVITTRPASFIAGKVPQGATGRLHREECSPGFVRFLIEWDHPGRITEKRAGYKFTACFDDEPLPDYLQPVIKH